jgi:hypothetical protein
MSAKTPPAYEGTAARLIAEGVPAVIANNPNDTAGLAAWLDREDES